MQDILTTQKGVALSQVALVLTAHARTVVDALDLARSRSRPYDDGGCWCLNTLSIEVKGYDKPCSFQEMLLALAISTASNLRRLFVVDLTSHYTYLIDSGNLCLYSLSKMQNNP